MIRAVVLAAGESRRMGTPKALLADGAGRVFVTRVLHTMAAAGIRDSTVVTGANHEAIVRAVAADPPHDAVVRFARNPHPQRGQLSSLLVGLDAADAPGVKAVAVTLVDVPFVSAATVRAVVDGFSGSRALLARPALAGRHGHPVVFDRILFQELREADPAAGAKAVVRAHEAEILNVEVPDEGAIIDVDTPAEYRRLLQLG